MRSEQFDGPLVDMIAERFKALGEPARLRILNALRGGEMSVNQLVDATGLGQANTSKHLRILHAHGFVARRKEGLHTYYALADKDVFALCDIVCGRLAEEAQGFSALLES